MAASILDCVFHTYFTSLPKHTGPSGAEGGGELKTGRKRVSRVSKCELAHALMALNNSGLSHADCQANAVEYCRAHCSRPTHSAEFNNVLTRCLLIGADVARPEIITVYTYSNLYSLTDTLLNSPCPGGRVLYKLAIYC